MNTNLRTTIHNAEYDTGKTSYLTKVLTWLAAALGATATITFLIAPHIPATLLTAAWVITSILVIILLLVSIWVRASKTYWLAPLTLLLFSTATGIDLYFIIVAALHNPHYGSVAVAALAVTSVVFVVMAILGWVTRLDLSRFGVMAMVALLMLIVLSIINSLFLHLPILAFIISCVTALTFMFFTAYDFQVIKNKGYGSIPASMMALSVFIDFWGLFKNIINIFSFLDQ